MAENDKSMLYPEMSAMRPWLGNLLALHRFELEFSHDGPAPADWHLTQRHLPGFHMVTARAGHGEYAIDGNWEPFYPGKIMFISPGIIHSSRTADWRSLELQTCRFWLIHRQTGQYVSTIDPPFTGGFEVRNVELFMRMFQDLRRQHSLASNAIGMEICNSIVTRIVCELALELSNESRGDARLQAVHRFMWEQPQARVALAELAEMASMSVRSFTQQFREAFGTSPIDYQIRTRCEQARYRLLESKLSIKEIALSLGYPDQFTFSKQFKRFSGRSPKDFRESMTGQ